MAAAVRDGARITLDTEAFGTSPSEPINYAVMERSDRVAVVPVAIGWSCLGSWNALRVISGRDAASNAHNGEVLAVNTRDCLVCSDGIRVWLVGVSDLIVVASGQDVLVLPCGRSQDRCVDTPRACHVCM